MSTAHFLIGLGSAITGAAIWASGLMWFADRYGARFMWAYMALSGVLLVLIGYAMS